MRPPQNAGESSRDSHRARRASSGFNEAPAERGGKCYRGIVAVLAHLASMRPPQNAGESRLHPASRRNTAGASMRPPQNAGESGPCGSIPLISGTASMRPPQNAGESGGDSS